ncbi:GNAT family N-acetyltransferase [Microcoleus sp. FACHB-1515]|uniref:GNAT family N-acetyltransferase n=1 Tax=Cyanophyceae TaxID=3028117 RepID=UPI0016844E9B|nr:GNAT family N-acetyltransferase [Microcoleus sp. FACHB-1515]MBD2089361.1 GNAT family N-acetyltransferase [Microcoleus sp. FACHB-1515]
MVTLWFRSWTQTFPNLHHPQSIEQWKLRFEQEYVGQAAIWVAADGDRILGFIVVGAGAIEQLFVAGDAQRNGIGAALLSQAKQMNPDGLRLTTLQQNQQARRFYEKHGFVSGETGVNPINGQPNIAYYWNQ